MVQSLTVVSVKLPPEDYALLVALEEHEKLRRSDILRRALRAYAETLGVKPRTGRKPKR
jgi:hypothetical protein